jgi:hypothetical protein
MPGFELSINDQDIGAISTDRLNVVAIHVHGDTIGPELAEIDVTGGRYGEEDDNCHLIYIPSREIVQNDMINIVFLEEE